MIFPYPKWVLEIPPGELQERAKERFLLHIACVYASRQGNIRALSDLIGIKYQTLKSQARGSSHHPVSEKTFDRISLLLGPSFTQFR